MASDDEGWIRPLTRFEEFLEMAHQHGFMITCYCLTLNSKLPLKEYHIKRSLLHLMRKVQSLRVCIRPNNEKLWFYKLENETIDFKVLENADFQKEYEDMTAHYYNTYSGPLWCARLLPCPSEAPCEMPEIKAEFTHQYQFLFGFHHSITDGMSSISICGFFIDLLNDVVAGKPINDLEQLAAHVSDEQTVQLIEEIGREMSKNPSELLKIQRILRGSSDDFPFLTAYPPPKDHRPKTLNITHSLSVDETTDFIKRCKKEAVTIHSGFCSVVNAAIVDLLIEAGVKEEVYEIKQYHAINLRRYWKNNSSKAFGPHFGKLTFIAEMTPDAEHFWNSARSFHQMFTSLLDDRGPLKEMLAEFSTMPADTDTSRITEYISVRNNNYGTTNMGNLSTMFRGEGDHVQVTNFRRTTSAAKNLCSHVMQTFRGRFLYGLDYEASLMTRETAKKYVNTIFRILHTVTYM